MIPAADIHLHRVEAVRATKCELMRHVPGDGGDYYRRILTIETATGSIQIAMWADDAQGLAIREAK